MSGGIAYVLDEAGELPRRINRQMVGTEGLEDAEEIVALRALIERHATLTGSSRARAVLDDWERMLPHFVRVIPRDYQRMLSCIRRAHEQGLSGDEAIMVAFEENARDLARVGGN
jgi:glutamate synthase (ferredoxin)